MVAARRVITLSIDPDQCCALANIARSRTVATGRVERARIILAYLAIREICARHWHILRGQSGKLVS